MELKLYNTLTRSKEVFKPLNGNEVRIYSCGPTVYGHAHIGNMRAYIFMDNLREVLKYSGYTLKHAMNITDVGHLTSDADEGEDKMEKAAREQKKSPIEIANHYMKIFIDDIHRLNINDPEVICRATNHIKEMEEYVARIVENGYGYETNKGIYFDVSKLPSYGELSRVDLEGQMSGARIAVDDEKRNPHDFAVWIKAPENHIMKWPSRWGVCYPGWHIECSAMSNKYLGEKFDIHTGGVDHIPIHHENEIAQAKGAYGVNPANIWMHTEFLLINGGKMSKSLGNTYTIDTLIENSIEPLSYRYFTYSSHYRNKLNFTWEAIKAADVSLKRLRENYKIQMLGTEDVENSVVEEYRNMFKEALSDDLNMPEALSIMWNVAKNKIKSKKFAALLEEMDKVMKLDLNKKEEEVAMPEEIEKILAERKLARENKDFKKSDELRDLLSEKGYEVKDTKEGQKINKI